MEQFGVEQSTIDQVKERIIDENFFTARLLAQISRKTGFPPISVAETIGGLVGLYLLFGTFNYFLANAILIAYPLLVTYMFTAEKPSRDNLLIYWGCYALLTLFDRALEMIFGYYVIKIALLVLLFLEPYHWVSCLRNALNEFKQKRNQETMPKSPPPEKPDEAAFNPKSPARVVSPPSVASNRMPARAGSKKRSQTKMEPVAEVPAAPVDANNNAASPSTVPSGKSEFVPTASSSKKSVRSMAMSDMPDRQPQVGQNPMLTDSAYKLSSTASLTSIGNKSAGPGVNPHDLTFFPGNKIIFNAPFDYDDITYHMRIVNTSHHNIAFAIKANCVPRVVAFPPSAIIRKGEKQVVAVTVKKFEYNDSDFNKDRIAFEYVLLQDAQKDVKVFDHSLLQNSDMKRRKNILIQYNP